MKFTISFLLLIASQVHVEATFTVAATDTATGQQGAAGCTCVVPEAVSLYNHYHSVVGKGVLLSQASPPDADSPVYSKAHELLSAGQDCDTVLQAITNDTSLDGESSIRQYACVDSRGNAAGYTGAGIQEFYDVLLSLNGEEVQPHAQVDEQGSAGSVFYSAQGNIVSKNTVPLLSDGFEQAEGCDLAGRLFRSIVAVDDSNNQARANGSSEDTNFEGDVRCENGIGEGIIPGYGYPGLQAYIHVEDVNGNEVLHIESLPEGGVNPYDEIREKYAQWRLANPCPSHDYSSNANAAQFSMVVGMAVVALATIMI
ncbi:expressed unknown protein [Seminavis robusta]|uniref:Uncharacterized protein n=1 Tax=Seminavis robusta TaxID=568900 RepID=A0A9N8HJ39_9STRA|nr:expressed unknown protein [Seminavis robusta]|eukprot:Sro831_g208340.1 n/a (313) ;mRNA; f:17807-18836